tara:strand:- start:94 stop:1479 length:1386 start_codon:yes stop_codon:yes gene_type:complete
MAAPQIKFKRGAQANLPALAAGEPAFVNDEFNLYLGLDGTSGNNKFLGSARYWVKETTTTGHAVKLYSRTDGSGGGSVSLQAPDVASDIVFALPAADGSNGHILTTDGSGNLSFAAPASSSFTIAAESGTSDTFNTGETLTFAAGEGIDTTVSNNQILIAAELASETNAGVATFDGTDFTVSSGDVTINEERIQDIAGAMIAGNSEDGIAVTYDDTNGKLDFNVADFTITLGGDLSGNVTITDLGNATLTATIVANSVALGTDTTGNYVEDVTAGAGLAKTSSAGEGQTVDLSIGAGTGITVNADDVELKNAGNLTDATLTAWDDSNGQLVDAPVTYSGNDITVAGDIVVGGNDIKSNGGTTVFTLSGANATAAGNIVINGDLTVSGSTTTVSTTNVVVDDAVMELGTVSGAAPSSAQLQTTLVSDSIITMALLLRHHLLSGTVTLVSSLFRMQLKHLVLN